MSDVHICVGTNQRFVGRFRRKKQRKWTVLPTEHLTANEASFALVSKMDRQNSIGEVLLTADNYDPVVVREISFLC